VICYFNTELISYFFRLINDANHGVSAPASGFGLLGDTGFISYPQACRFVAAEAATVFDRDSRVPYAYKNTQWISYDDERSLAYKVCTSSSTVCVH
jgi:chitinase